jgi:hypothetical protein
MDFPPRKVMVIEATTRRVVADFAPGVAGQLEWSADDRIIHRFGFGTGRHAKIYDSTGKEIFSTNPPFELFERCEIEVHPSRRALVMLPTSSSSPSQIMLVRTLDGAIHRVGPERIICRDWSHQGQALRVEYAASPGEDAPAATFDVQIPHDWIQSGTSGLTNNAAPLTNQLNRARAIP